MPKKKSYDVEQVKIALESYFHSVCFGDVKKLKMTQLCRYLRENGFPEVNDRKLNRDQEIRSFIANLKESINDTDYMTIISYTPLNTDEFIKTNNSIEKLRVALTNLDNYYGNLCTSVVSKHEESQSIAGQIAEQIIELSTLREELMKSKEEISRFKRINKELELENKRYKRSIKDTLLPEIANEMLRKEHVIYDGESVVSQNGYEKMVMDDASSLKDELNDIKKKESKFRNSLVSGLFDSINED